jgi:hypothetical protein
MKNEVIITETLNEDEFCVRVTQRYSTEHDQGHWMAYVTRDGHIVSVRESGPAMPKNRISPDTCKMVLNLYLRSLDL